MNEKSETEQFYAAVCNKMQMGTSWNELHPQHQMMVIQAINMILQVVHNGGKQ